MPGPKSGFVGKCSVKVFVWFSGQREKAHSSFQTLVYYPILIMLLIRYGKSDATWRQRRFYSSKSIESQQETLTHPTTFFAAF